MTWWRCGLWYLSYVSLSELRRNIKRGTSCWSRLARQLGSLLIEVHEHYSLVDRGYTYNSALSFKSEQTNKAAGILNDENPSVHIVMLTDSAILCFHKPRTTNRSLQLASDPDSGRLSWLRVWLWWIPVVEFQSVSPAIILLFLTLLAEVSPCLRPSLCFAWAAVHYRQSTA